MVVRRGTRCNYPDNWEDYKTEIDALFRTFVPDYETKQYITPGLYFYYVGQNPKQFPLLSSIRQEIAKRYVAYFLKDQGRLPGGTNKMSVWVRPDAYEVSL